MLGEKDSWLLIGHCLNSERYTKNIQAKKEELIRKHIKQYSKTSNKEVGIVKKWCYPRS